MQYQLRTVAAFPGEESLNPDSIFHFAADGLLCQFTQRYDLHFTFDIAFHPRFDLSGAVPQRQIQCRNACWRITQRVDCKDFATQYDPVARHLGRGNCRSSLTLALGL